MHIFSILSRWRSWAGARTRLSPSSGPLGGSFHLRHLDAGSCNACEAELQALSGPHYDSSRAGIGFVASPRHADAVIMTGPITRNLAEAVLLTVQATPKPRIVVACGDCACGTGPLAGSYALVLDPTKVVRAEVHIPGCPPAPARILEGIAEARSALR